MSTGLDIASDLILDDPNFLQWRRINSSLRGTQPQALVRQIKNRTNDLLAKFTTSPYFKLKTNPLLNPKLPVAEEMHQTRQKLMAEPLNLIHPLY